MDCTSCDKRETCTELCPDHEEFANQDYVARDSRQIILEPARFEEMASNIDWSDIKKTKSSVRVNLTHREMEILRTMFVIVKNMGHRHCNEAIGYLGLTRSGYRTHLQRLKDKVFKGQPDKKGIIW